jgi:hypothetical protein
MPHLGTETEAANTQSDNDSSPGRHFQLHLERLDAANFWRSLCAPNMPKAPALESPLETHIVVRLGFA